MSYLAGMGVTAIWISPPVDNLNTNIPDGSGNPTASYHGYQGRDFKRIEEHSADTNNGWTTFDAFVAAAHAAGIKVIVDFAPNHSTQDNAGEFGAIYDNGTFLGNYTNDTNGYFHHNGNIQNWDDRYQVQYYTLFNLADINQANPTMDAYMKNAAKLFMDHGVDGFRVDAIKHITWGWQYSLANTIYTHGDSFIFGEWYQTGTSDPLYRDSYKYANKSGISMLDFPLNTAIRNVFGSNANFSELDAVLTAEAANFTWDEDLVTFVDNHDMTRFLTVNSNQNRLHQAMAFILTQRGIPCIYYGTEQYLVNNTSGGGDPYNRPMMNAFSTSTTAYTLTNRLSTLRRNNTAIPYGSTQQRWINNDVYIYERKFYGNVVLVAINKNTTTQYNISGLNTSLPAGAYSDHLTGLLSGVNISVSSGSGRQQPRHRLQPPGEQRRRLAVHRVGRHAADRLPRPYVGAARRQGHHRRQELRLDHRHRQVRHDDRDHRLVVADEDRRQRPFGRQRQLQRDGHELFVAGLERHPVHGLPGEAHPRHLHRLQRQARRRSATTSSSPATRSS